MINRILEEIEFFEEGWISPYELVNQIKQIISLCQCDKPSPDIMYGKTCTECCLEIDSKA